MRISAEDIGYSYRKKGRSIRVLETVSFAPKAGELTVITGRSGSGKTTLLNVLAGLLIPEDGRVMYDGRDICRADDGELSAFRNVNIGYIPQGHSALANLTLLQNILLPAALAGEDRTDTALELLQAVGLEKLKNAYPDELSGGELRRLAAARALINSPTVIFADEPTNDLDDENAAVILSLLKARAKEGAAVIIVTHDNMVSGYAYKVYTMDGGRLSEKENDHDDTLCRPLVS
ncbi:ATP-binding cassette domain-containing protein [Ruminococcus sp.]|uniref:ABC transporter ATP-binding protein n=1 Tax=Ruminococcus sp. TaxID=41978 RepID=UPI0025DA2910|nr:ATP-binding cassette domain-containing protein [Ruminococcus sp.]MBQ8967542.1 ATP-binding cassette domain-containing protein [Ruminococcus sp.]